MYVHETPFTYVYDKFEYYAEDMECNLCAYFKQCAHFLCKYQNLKDDAVKNNRINRPKGWQKKCNLNV